MMCQFVDDIDVVVNMLRQRQDFKVIENVTTSITQNKVVIVHIM